MLPLKTPIAAVALTVTVYAQPSFHLVAWSPSIDADTVLYYDEERNLRTTSVNTFGDSTLNGSTYTATGELNTRYEVVYNHESIPLKVVLYNDADSVVSRDMSISSPPRSPVYVHRQIVDWWRTGFRYQLLQPGLAPRS
jgi:hypothetical protein